MSLKRKPSENGIFLRETQPEISLRSQANLGAPDEPGDNTKILNFQFVRTLGLLLKVC